MVCRGVYVPSGFLLLDAVPQRCIRSNGSKYIFTRLFSFEDL